MVIALYNTFKDFVQNFSSTEDKIRKNLLAVIATNKFGSFTDAQKTALSKKIQEKVKIPSAEIQLVREYYETFDKSLKDV